MNGYIQYNANPKRSRVGDCVIRGEYPARSRYSRDDRGTSERRMDYRDSMADRW